MCFRLCSHRLSSRWSERSLFLFSLHLSVSVPFSPLLDGARAFLLSSWSNGIINRALWERNCSASYRILLPIADSQCWKWMEGNTLPPGNWGFLLVWSGIFDFLSWTLQSGFSHFYLDIRTELLGTRKQVALVCLKPLHCMLGSSAHLLLSRSIQDPDTDKLHTLLQLSGGSGANCTCVSSVW